MAALDRHSTFVSTARSRTALSTLLGGFLTITSYGQTAYPELTIQDVTWENGTHHYAVTNKILSPSTPALPTVISGTADAEFVSATEVRLRPGFHAGSFSNTTARFRARIDAGLGDPADLVIISPAPDGSSPYGSIEDNVVHVHKWEKVEVGVKLPEEFQAAIDSFFSHYYSNGTGQLATPGQVDDLHDLNPYADDSLQVVLKLTDPFGTPRLKWGFFMREAMWDPQPVAVGLAQQIANENTPLDAYRIRCRFAPDLEGPWHFSISIKAPYTLTTDNVPLPDLLYAGYDFVCDPPLPDNKGPLSVNPNNHRALMFGDIEPAEPFIALGTNMADVRHSESFAGAWDQFHEVDFDQMKESMGLLHDVGGNFFRMFLLRNLFAPEWVNLGVYDSYKEPPTCDNSPPNNAAGNCQYQSWAFDGLLDHARANNIYIQLCIDPYPPIIAFEDILWGAHPYSLNYLETNRDPNTGRFDMNEFFYSPDPEGPPQWREGGAFYYWKRKYKYIMSRWGYSVNLPIIEPFNEIDQMLTYRYADLGSTAGKCTENRIEWPRDTLLPHTLNSWLSDIGEFVRGDQVIDSAATSPLGEEKLFLMSYTQAEDENTAVDNYFLPFRNDEVDLIDVHKGLHPTLQGPGNETDVSWVEPRMHEGFKHANDFWGAFPAQSAGLSERKPFNHGEFNYYTNFIVVDPVTGDTIWKNDVEKIFHNYDVSFHNELWSSVFSGKFAAGSTWHWERVFWWDNALVAAPEDEFNQFSHPTSSTQFSSAHDDVNQLYLGDTTFIPITNRKLHHHFGPLANFLSRPSVQELGIFQGPYTPVEVFDPAPASPNPIECYYLKDPSSTMAIGWVHNRNASVAKSYYVKSGSGNENFLGCAAPIQQYVDLPGFAAGQDYYIYWLPTRQNVPPEDLPLDTTDTDGNGTVRLDLSSRPLGGVLNNYLDTLHADYAFIISPAFIVKNLDLPQAEGPSLVDDAWDFTLYPNPTRGQLFIHLPDEEPKEIVLYDPAGRRLQAWGSITATTQHLAVEELAQGVYWVRVSDGVHSRTKKLLVH